VRRPGECLGRPVPTTCLQRTIRASLGRTWSSDDDGIRLHGISSSIRRIQWRRRVNRATLLGHGGNMTVLVTGAGGFIGGHLVGSLLRKHSGPAV